MSNATRRRVRILNRTGYPDPKLQGVVYWVMNEAPSRPRTISIGIRKRDTGITATAYLDRQVVEIGLAKPGWFWKGGGYPNDHRYPGVKGAPPYTAYDWREELVAMLAHELMHVAGEMSELESDRAAVRALRVWRHEHPVNSITLWTYSRIRRLLS